MWEREHGALGIGCAGNAGRLERPAGRGLAARPRRTGDTSGESGLSASVELSRERLLDRAATARRRGPGGRERGGDRSWLEGVPLIGGGVAVRRADLAFGTSYAAPVTRRYVAVVGSGTVQFSSPPGWMTALGGATLQIVRGGRAYAVLPEGGSAAPCTQRIEVLAPDGTSCGGADYPIADASCTTLPLTVGADGTVVQQLPTSLEPTVPYSYGGVAHGCTWRWWTGALR